MFRIADKRMPGRVLQTAQPDHVLGREHAEHQGDIQDIDEKRPDDERREHEQASIDVVSCAAKKQHHAIVTRRV